MVVLQKDFLGIVEVHIAHFFYTIKQPTKQSTKTYIIRLTPIQEVK